MIFVNFIKIVFCNFYDFDNINFIGDLELFLYIFYFNIIYYLVWYCDSGYFIIVILIYIYKMVLL